MVTGWEPGPNSGANSRVKSKTPLSPVRSITVRSTDCLKNCTNMSIVILLDTVVSWPAVPFGLRSEPITPEDTGMARLYTLRKPMPRVTRLKKARYYEAS